MAFECRILLDSLAPCGKRLTTFIVTYPRFIHSELLTHRMLSRSSASSRAIPWEKWVKLKPEEEFTASDLESIICTDEEGIQCYKLHPKCMKYMLLTDPVMPIHWGTEQKGMQSGDTIDDPTQANDTWIIARNNAIDAADRLAKLGVHKSLVNRLTESFMWITVIVSATEWKNFWTLRCHRSAERHFQKIANMMKESYDASVPQKLKLGEIHLPFITEEDKVKIEVGLPTYEKYGRDIEKLLCMISAGRCARVSYLTHDGIRSHQEDINLFEKLMMRTVDQDEPLHSSPTEHVAMALGSTESFSGNYCGFRQFRKMFDNECVKG